MARIISVSSYHERPLTDNWQFCAPESPLREPARLDQASLRWFNVVVPGTAAVALRAAGLSGMEDNVDLDAREFWWRCEFDGDPGLAGSRVLHFDGLATVCQIWLNGVLLLRSESMFQTHTIDVSAHLIGRNKMLLRFAPLEEALSGKKSRPRWKCGLVRQQQVRWLRASVFGRSSAWPVSTPVGPWRAIRLERRGPDAVLKVDLKTALVGEDGVASLCMYMQGVGTVKKPINEPAEEPIKATLRVGRTEVGLVVTPGPNGVSTLTGRLVIPGVQPWWPATHGAPFLYSVSVDFADGSKVDLGEVGFRRIEVDRSGGAFALSINGVSIFCRGACWTPLDADALDAPDERYRSILEAARDAGMNVIRVAGNFVYERDVFYDLCDRLGLMVWQDLMFAGLDYPGDDPEFQKVARGEACALAERLQTHPSLVIFCGGSEVYQQAALLGRSVEPSRGRLFEDVLRLACAESCPDIPYVLNSPEDVSACRVDVGVSHWFGVGAYLRPIEDARRSQVRFATESLGFANVPEQELLDAWLGNAAPVVSPRWKQGVPRDGGAAWDFDDVRDYYLGLLHDVAPARLRSEDPQRYLDLSRVVTGEVMEAAFSELRSNGICAGALVWNLTDLRPGAGWGLLDVRGRPKPAFWLMRRALSPLVILITDEGLNGLSLHIVNDKSEPFTGSVELGLWRNEASVASGIVPLTVPGRGYVRLTSHAVLGRFADEACAFHFGPPAHDVAVARLLDASDTLRSEACFFPVAGRRRVMSNEPGLEVRVSRCDLGYLLHLTTRRFAFAVSITTESPCRPDECWLHISPGRSRTVFVHGISGAQLRGEARPLNGSAVRFAADLESVPKVH